SSQTRKRAYTPTWPTWRSERNAIVGARLRWRWIGGAVVAELTVTVVPEVASVVPLAFEAVTTTWSTLPTSAARTPDVFPVAPETSVQPVPPGRQRCHWKANDLTPPVHVPGSAVSSSPTCAVPEMLGFAVFTGSAFDEIISVVFDSAVDWPSALEAVTTTRSVWSTSAEAAGYDRSCAPVPSAHPVPDEPQRCHW